MKREKSLEELRIENEILKEELEILQSENADMEFDRAITIAQMPPEKRVEAENNLKERMILIASWSERLKEKPPSSLSSAKP